MLKLVFASWLLASCGFNPQALAQEQDSNPPKELVQYVRDAKKAGQNDFQIQQNAVTSGWPQALVDKAIASVRADQPEPSAKPAADKPDKADPSPKADKPPADKPAGDAGSPPPGTPAATAEKAKIPADAAGSRPATNRGVPDDYQFGAGDVVEINVWKEPDVSVHGVVVRPDGKISVPVLKDVYVVGLTPIQLEKQITDGLSGLLNSPDVTIVVTGINSKKIYVMGKVKKEGPIPYTYQMTVMQALSEAGGITDYAKKKAIYVLRKENGKEFRLPFDYAAVLKGQRMELNIPLISGDVIVVP